MTESKPEYVLPATGVVKAQLIQVVATAAIVGEGRDGDPIRRVTAYWSPEGDLLAIADPILDPRLTGMSL